MNREEAINVIKGARQYLTVGNPIWNVKKVDEAFDMAIEALTEPINCVKCEHYYETEDDTDVHGHCRMDTAHTNPISKAVQGCDINEGAWLIPISLVALTVAVVGLLAEIHFLFL